jgi:hypothetical protein
MGLRQLGARMSWTPFVRQPEPLLKVALSYLGEPAPPAARHADDLVLVVP